MHVVGESGPGGVVQSLCPADQPIVRSSRNLRLIVEESAGPHRTGGSVPGQSSCTRMFAQRRYNEMPVKWMLSQRQNTKTDKDSMYGNPTARKYIVYKHSI